MTMNLEKYELIIMEGAGSCAEVNLIPQDIVNFRMAGYADAPVILVGDIHRGGIFAQLVGTLACLPKKIGIKSSGLSSYLSAIMCFLGTKVTRGYFPMGLSSTKIVQPYASSSE